MCNGKCDDLSRFYLARYQGLTQGVSLTIRVSSMRSELTARGHTSAHRQIGQQSHATAVLCTPNRLCAAFTIYSIAGPSLLTCRVSLPRKCIPSVFVHVPKISCSTKKIRPVATINMPCHSLLVNFGIGLLLFAYRRSPMPSGSGASGDTTSCLYRSVLNRAPRFRLAHPPCPNLPLDQVLSRLC